MNIPQDIRDEIIETLVREFVLAGKTERIDRADIDRYEAGFKMGARAGVNEMANTIQNVTKDSSYTQAMSDMAKALIEATRLRNALKYIRDTAPTDVPSWGESARGWLEAAHWLAVDQPDIIRNALEGTENPS